MSVYSRRFFSVLVVFVISLLYIFNSFASTAGSATPSDATQVKDKQFDIATSSNTTPLDDFVESDDFDTLDMPLYMASGDEFSIIPSADVRNSSTGEFIRSYNGIYKGTSSGYNFFRFPTLPSGQAYNVVYYYLPKEYFPKPGTYGVTFKFAIGDIGFTSNYAKIYIRSGGQNISESSNDARATLNRDGNIFSCTGNVKIDYSTTKVGFGVLISERLQNVDIGIPVSNPYTFTFKQQSGETAIPPSSDTGNGGVSDAIADNTAQQVEQGDTIIELIKNTIQTISSQLTAFWNQLAGEFTNLYSKMSQQHSEQLQADRENTDDIIAADDANTNKVTTAIESHGNFIIEGLKKLFIPSDEYFKAYFDDLYSWFSERFGFLSFPIDLLLEVIDIFVNSSQTDCVLVLPSFTIMENLLWPEMSFNLTEFLDTNFSFVVVAIKTVTSIYLVMAFVQLCEEKWNEVMMN